MLSSHILKSIADRFYFACKSKSFKLQLDAEVGLMFLHIAPFKTERGHYTQALKFYRWYAPSAAQFMVITW